ncbi:MAG: AmmeMemoRadiSam system protein B [Candidatus Brocadiia bacterium]
MTRKPVVDGQFYPRSAEELRAGIESYTPEEAASEPALGLLSPHAGYTFSGPVAGKAFARAEVSERVVLLTPSHNFSSPPFALWTGGGWETPLGTAGMDQQVTSALAELPMVTVNDRPHVPEHSGEVVVPFLHYHRPDVRLSVVCITASAGLDDLLAFGSAVARVLTDCEARDSLVVASSDMSHESGAGALEVVDQNDPLAIEQMERLDPEGLYRTVRGNGITMCGVLPAAAMMQSVAERGGTAGELVARATSADAPMGRGSYVVGYAGMVFR